MSLQVSETGQNVTDLQPISAVPSYNPQMVPSLKLMSVLSSDVSKHMTVAHILHRNDAVFWKRTTSV